MVAIMGWSCRERSFAKPRQPECSSLALNRFAIALWCGQHPTSDGLSTLNFVAPAA
jgi:hypothetical protein